ncbi:VWA domain-containing protein [Acidicapsa ligni]|uniref:VWA domain-containing protein n=1 Tax=Acidicapsa ligni TaxID=542300 RepID=UPI0021E0841E|nr:VWA domain-containing protein [Acidicapsa ligni]
MRTIKVLQQIQRITASALALLIALFLPMYASGQQESANQDSGFVLKAESDLVLTNIVVRDSKTGEVVRGLKQSDFTILENGKPQRISSFDFESVDMAQPLNEATISGIASSLQKKTPGGTTRPEDLRNHRLIVFFFDLTSMQPEDLDRCIAAAKDFLNTRMQPADLVALVSLDTSLKVDQDFTTDKQLLIGKIGTYNGTEGAAFAQGANANSNQVEDASGYTPDETEYNDINTDRELYALRSISQSLEKINQKKSLLYFSGGLSRDGIENQASLRSAINAAVRANLSIYSVDTRGLQAISIGDASTGSLRGTGGFNGSAIQNNFNANFASQETMTTLSADTGGKAFLDSNDFAPAFSQVQRDSSAYYVLGFHPSNPARDGRYRKLQVKVNRPGVKLEYRPGYYAPADFKHSGKEDRERELDEQLASDLPATDVSMYLEAYYFQIEENRFFVPVSLIVPGSQIPFVKGGDHDKATLDVIGEVIDEAKRPIGQVRETVKLAVDGQQQVRQKNIQYSTSFKLPAGKYHVKFVVRENQTGNMGSFETDITLPDMRKVPLKLSSVLLASMRTPVKQDKTDSPLIRAGQQYVPNISHVFRQGQHLYVLYEVYGPTRVKQTGDAPKIAKGAINLATSLELIQGSTKVFETPVLQAQALNVSGRDAVAVELDVPLDKLKPGPYIGQLNIVDDAGGSFAFPRFAVLVREPDATTAPTPVTGAVAGSGGAATKTPQN